MFFSQSNKQNLIVTQCNKLIPFLWPLVLGLAVLLGVLASAHFYNQTRLAMERTSDQQVDHARIGQLLVKDTLNNWFQYFEQTARLLADSKSVQQFVFEPSLANKQIIEQQWQLMALSTETFSQIRLLDNQGFEQIRINYDADNLTAEPAAQLQNKSNRGYFTLAQTLTNDQVLIDAFNLEVEHGMPLVPETLAGRFIAPVVVDQQVTGYIVLNLNMQQLLSRINERQQVLNSGFQLLNADGFLLADDQSSRPFSNQRSYRTHYHLEEQSWRAMFKDGQGVQDYQWGKLVFSTLDLGGDNTLVSDDTRQVILLTDIDTSFVNALHFALSRLSLSDWLVRFAVLFGLSLLGALLLRHVLGNLKTQKLMLNAVSSMAGVILTDKNHHVIGVNNEFCELSGFDAKELMNQLPDMLLPETGEVTPFWDNVRKQLAKNERWQGEVCLRCKNQTSLLMWIEIRALQFNTKRGVHDFFVTNVIDFSARRELEKELLLLSTTDPLTGLYNRRYFDNILERMLNVSERYPESTFSLMLIDADHFKQVNDQYGHAVGDEVLKNISSVMQSMLRNTDMLARIGGEEFALILPQTGIQQAHKLAQRLNNLVKQSTDDPKVTVSIGVMEFANALGAEEMFKLVDEALYQAKAQGRDQVVVAKPTRENQLESPGPAVLDYLEK